MEFSGSEIFSCFPLHRSWDIALISCSGTILQLSHSRSKPQSEEGRRGRLAGGSAVFLRSFQKLPHESFTGQNLATGPHLTARKSEKCSHTSGQPYVQLKILLLRILQILWDGSPSVPQCDIVLLEGGIRNSRNTVKFLSVYILLFPCKSNELGFLPSECSRGREEGS